MDYTVIIVYGFDDLPCNDHKMVRCYYGHKVVMEFDGLQHHDHMHGLQQNFCFISIPI